MIMLATRVIFNYILPVDREVIRQSKHSMLKLFWREQYRFQQAPDYSDEKESRRETLMKLRRIIKDMELIIMNSYEQTKAGRGAIESLAASGKRNYAQPSAEALGI